MIVHCLAPPVKLMQESKVFFSAHIKDMVEAKPCPQGPSQSITRIRAKGFLETTHRLEPRGQPPSILDKKALTQCVVRTTARGVVCGGHLVGQ